MEQDRSIKYGDRILLRNRANRIVLSSRGFERHAGIFIKLPEEEFIDNPLLYPGLFEMVFEVHPQLNYEALKDFQEMREDDPSRANTQKRMKLEEILNKTKLAENKDKPVYLGSIVQLFHVATQTYVQLNPDRMTDSDMGIVGASKKTNERVQFKVALPFSFYRKGTPLNYDTGFVLYSATKETLAYPINFDKYSNFEIKFRPEKAQEGFHWFRADNNKRELELPFTLENQKYFKGYHAGYVNMSDISTSSFGNDFQAVNVTSYFREVEGSILWGNSVHIRRMDTATGKVSMLTSEVNRSATKNSVWYRSVDHIESKKVIGVESVFQIIPLKLEEIGHKMKFDQSKSIVCLIKCTLSGKFLKEDLAKKELVIAEDYSIEKERIQSQKESIEKEFKEKLNRYSNGNYAPDEFSQMDILLFQTRNKEYFKNEKDYFTEYLRRMSFRLQKMSSDDDPVLTNANFFKIVTPNGRLLSITDLNSQTGADSATRGDFIPNFESALRELYVEDEKVISENQGNKFDLFFFQEVGRHSELALARISPILPSLCQAASPESIDAIFLIDYTESIKKLIRIFHEIVSEKILDKVEVQSLYRQASIIDLVMRFLVQASKMPTDTNLLFTTLEACTKSVSLLEILIKGNPVNALYIFQWRQFITGAILVGPQELFTRIHLDSAYFTIIDLLQYKWVYTQDFLEPLCSRIRFSQFDCHKIDILFKILNAFRHSSDEKSSEVIYQNIFKKSNQAEIFKNFQINASGAVEIKLERDQKIIVDSTILNDLEKYEYLLKVLGLASLLTEIDLLRVANKLAEIFPKEVGKKIIDDQGLPGEFRCLMLNIYSAVFILGPVYHFKTTKVTDKIIVPADISPSNSPPKVRVASFFAQPTETTAANPITHVLEQADLAAMVRNADNTNYLTNFLESSGNKEIMYSSLKIIYQLLETNLFTRQDIIDMKERIDKIIQIENETEEKEVIHKSVTKSSSYRDLTSLYLQTSMNDNEWTSTRRYSGDGTMADDYSEELVLEVQGEVERHGAGERHQYRIQMIDILMKINEQLIVMDLKESLVNNKNLRHDTSKVGIGKDATRAKKKKTTEIRSPSRSPRKRVTGIGTVILNSIKFEINFDRLITIMHEIKFRNNARTTKLVSHWLDHQSHALFIKVLEYYQRSCRQRYFLFKQLQGYLIITDGNDLNRYEGFQTAANNILKAMRHISRDFHTSGPTLTRMEIENLQNRLQEKLLQLFEPVNREGRLRQLEYSIKEQLSSVGEHSLKNQLSVKEEGILFNVLNYYYMRLDDIVTNQKIMMKSGFLMLMIDSIIFLNTKIFSKTPSHKTIQFEHRRAFDESIFSTKYSGYNILNLTVLLLLYYSTFHNSTVASYLLTSHGDKTLTLLISYLASEETIFKKLSLMILTCILGSHFDTIYSLNKKYRKYIHMILDMYCNDIRLYRYDVLVNYVEFFRCVTVFHNVVFEKNFELVYEAIAGDKSHKATHFQQMKNFNDGVKQKLESVFSKNDLKACSERRDFRKERQARKEGQDDQKAGVRASQNVISTARMDVLDDIDETDSVFSIVNIPGIVIYACELMRYLTYCGSLATNEVKNSIRKLVSIDWCLSVFQLSKEFWFFKVTVLNFLISAHINQKLETKVKGEIFQFIKDSLMTDLKEYVRLRSINKYVKHLYMMSEFTKGSSLLLKRDGELRPCYNFFCYEYHDSQQYYIKESIVAFIKGFSNICHLDKNINIMDSIIDILNEQKVLNPTTILNLAFQEQNSDGVKGAGTVGSKKESQYFANSYKESIDSKKAEIFRKLGELFEEEVLRDTLFGTQYDVEQLDQYLIQEYISKEIEFEEKAFDEIKNQYLAEFSDFNKILKGMLSEDKFKGQESRYDYFLKECCGLLSNGRVEGKSLLLIIKYLLEQISLKKDLILPFLEKLASYKLVNHLVTMIETREKDKGVILKAIELLKVILSHGCIQIQNNLSDELSRDADNKFPNIISKYLEESIVNFMELETLKAQSSRVRYQREYILSKLEDKCVKQQDTITEIVETLRLMCEGHFAKLQNYLRVQTMGNNLLKPFQVNFIEKLVLFFKNFIKVCHEDNEQIAVYLLRFFVELVQGPCRDNQVEFIKRKLLEPLEDFHHSLIYSTLNLNKDSRIELINIILTLKLGIIESTKEKLVIKSLAIGLNLDLVWMRITSIYCDINNIRAKFLQMDQQDTIGAKSSLDMPTSMSKDMMSNILGGDEVSEQRKFKPRKIDKHTTYSINMVEALNSIILLSQLANFGEEISQMIEQSFRNLSEQYKIVSKARKFFTEKIQSIEFVDADGNIQTLFFYIHPKTEFLSKISSLKFETHVDRRNWNSKAADLMRFVSRAYLEIQHNYWLYTIFGVHISVSYFYIIKLINFLIAIVVNIIFLINQEMSDESGKNPVFYSWKESSTLEKTTWILCLIMLGNYIVALILYLSYEFTVKLKIFKLQEEEATKDYDTQHGTHLKTEPFYWARWLFFMISRILFNTKIILILGLLSCCCLGLTRSKLYFSLILLDIIDISPTLMSVIKSVTINLSSLSTTWIFIILMCYIYSTIIYYNGSIRYSLVLLDQPELDVCPNLPICFWNVVTFGIRSGGGIGEVMQEPDPGSALNNYIYRTIFDLVFFVTMILILMNIILGIIIDSFAELRDRRNQIGSFV